MIRSDGRNRLEVTVVRSSFDPLGYRSDKQLIHGKKEKHLTQNEERETLSVDVTLIDENGVALFGPTRVCAYVDYDYVDGDSSRDLRFSSNGEKYVVLPFSLGQLESQESAQEAAQKPLYRKISQKIVDLILRPCTIDDAHQKQCEVSHENKNVYSEP